MTIKKSAFLSLLLIVLVAILVVGCGLSAPTSTTAPPAAPGTTAGGGTATTASSSTGSSGSTDGAAVFANYCVSCHGQSGQGGAGPNLTHETDIAKVENQVRNGGKIMPPFGGQLSDAQITAVAQFVLSLAGK